MSTVTLRWSSLINVCERNFAQPKLSSVYKVVQWQCCQKRSVGISGSCWSLVSLHGGREFTLLISISIHRSWEPLQPGRHLLTWVWEKGKQSSISELTPDLAGFCCVWLVLVTRGFVLCVGRRASPKSYYGQQTQKRSIPDCISAAEQLDVKLSYPFRWSTDNELLLICLEHRELPSVPASDWQGEARMQSLSFQFTRNSRENCFHY